MRERERERERERGCYEEMMWELLAQTRKLKVNKTPSSQSKANTHSHCYEFHFEKYQKVLCQLQFGSSLL